MQPENTGHSFATSRYHSDYYVMYRQLLWTHTFMYFDSTFLFPHGVFDPENWKVGGNHRRVMHCILPLSFFMKVQSSHCTLFFTSRSTTQLQVQVQVPSLAIQFSQPGSKVVTKRAFWPFGSSF